MKRCPLCDNQLIELQDMRDIRIFGLGPADILFLKEFYINKTGDTQLLKLVKRTTEDGLKGP